MKSVIAVLLLLCLTAECREKVPYAVWKGRECVSVSDIIEVSALMVDGQPDMKHLVIKGLLIDMKCMSFDMRPPREK